MPDAKRAYNGAAPGAFLKYSYIFNFYQKIGKKFIDKEKFISNRVLLYIFNRFKFFSNIID